MRIAIFSDNFYPELSGISESITITGAALARRGHHITYFVPAYPKKSYQIGGVLKQGLNLGPNIEIRRILSFPFKAPTLQGRAAIPAPLHQIFARNKFDILHSQSFFGPGLDALCLSKIKKIPLVGTNHTLIEEFIRYSPLKNKWLNNLTPRYVIWYFNKCNFVTTPSEFLMDDMKAKGLKSPVTAVSNPIANQFFHPLSKKNILKKELGFPEFTVLYVGRISEEKNIKILLDAFISFAQNTPCANLVIVGQGASRAKLEEYARQSGISPQIKIIGPFLGGKKKTLHNIFHACDVFVMPSVSETQSMTTLEAMASGMPVIAARAGALPELVSPERGFLFEPSDSKKLRSHLTLLYSQPKLRGEIGHHARLFAEQFTEQKIADKWEKIYTKVIKHPYVKL